MTSAGERQVEVPAWVRAQPGRTIVALPAYNEEDALPRLLRRVHEAMVDARLEYEIIVVDDGSTDETPMILQQHARFLPLTTVTHERNAGLSQTIFDALQAALQRATPRDVIVSMDADDTHAPGVILRMVRMVREGYQVVIASRYREGSVVRGVPFGRRALSRLASLTSRLFAPIPGVRDYTCGYRAYDVGS
ncbi:MAG: glycosyltransferase family 2 protein [Armatimonadota bacterium]